MHENRFNSLNQTLNVLTETVVVRDLDVLKITGGQFKLEKLKKLQTVLQKLDNGLSFSKKRSPIIEEIYEVYGESENDETQKNR